MMTVELKVSQDIREVTIYAKTSKGFEQLTRIADEVKQREDYAVATAKIEGIHFLIFSPSPYALSGTPE